MTLAAGADIDGIEWYREVPRSIGRQTTIGLVLIALTFGGFGTWAATAPLAAAVISQGSFVATGRNKVIQHLEGGIIEDILVSEGDTVHRGQALLHLDETAARVKDRQVLLRQARLEAIIARLKAEARGEDRITFAGLAADAASDPEVGAIRDSQIENFRSARRRLDTDIALYERNRQSLQFRVQGYEGQRTAMHSQRRFLQEELDSKMTLFNRGLMRASEIKALQRAMADADGQLARLDAEIAETGAQIDKLGEEIDQTIATFRQTALEELQSIEAELDTIREQAHESRSVLDRAIVHSPVDGVVVRLHYHTPGGVIESGKPIMELVPLDVPLIIEVQIQNRDIDLVKTGQEATVRLTALNARTTPTLTGRVYYVSADALAQENNEVRTDIYVARIELPVDELKRVRGFSPTPGMPAEVMIQTAERTFLEYLLKPVRDSMARAFLEQ